MITIYFDNINKPLSFDIHRLYATMTEQSIITAFLGDFDHNTTTTLLENFKKRMTTLETSTGINKRVYKIMVECLENIGRHKVSKLIHNEVPSDSAIFLIAKKEDAFYISTGNYINVAQAKTLQEKIDTINSFTKVNLKKHYKQVLAESKQNNSVGAGIGLIDIIIKTDNPLKYRFLTISDQYSFFILEITINYKKK